MAKKATKSKKLPFVIVRSWGAGVFAGELVSRDDSGAGRSRVVLNHSTRLWSWKATNGLSLSAVAIGGLNRAESETAGPIDGHTIDDVIEIIPVSAAAEGSLR